MLRTLYRCFERLICRDPVHSALTAADIVSRIGHYGFTEVSDILASLTETDPCRPDMRYIRERLLTCLNNHDRGEEWFIPLRNLQRDTEVPKMS